MTFLTDSIWYSTLANRLESLWWFGEEGIGSGSNFNVRVAIRRLRAAMSLFGDLLRDPQTAAIKLVIVNNKSSEISAFVDFENVFGFDQLASIMIRAIGHEPDGDFGAAMRYVMNTMSIPQLLIRSELAPD